MNSFGSSTRRYPLVDPRAVRDARARFRRGAVPMLERANSLYVPAGRCPARGWVLLPRSEYVLLDRYSTDLRLEFGNAARANNVGIFRGLSIVQAQCVTTGLASDEDAIYLIELTDARGVIHNKWFSAPTTSAYNIRSPAYPQTFHPSSMDGGTTWTWTKMLQNLWEQMPLLGAYPGLPFVPAGTPEGFWFQGVSAWTALCDMLDHLGLAVACDLTAAAPYIIVSIGANDAAFDTLHEKYTVATSPLCRIEDDQEWIDTGAGRVPKTVKVLFRRRNSIYGTEETVAYRNDGMAQQWNMNVLYSVSITAPAVFADAIGTHYLWSDFTVRYDLDSVPLPDDVTIAQAIAIERVSQYFDRIYSRTLGFMSRTYAGALPFTTGSQVDGVCWYQDYRNNDRAGWRTQIVRGMYPPFNVWP